MLRVMKKEVPSFRVIVRDETTRKAVSFPVIDGDSTTKEDVLEICKNAIDKYSKGLNKTKPNKNK